MQVFKDANASNAMASRKQVEAKAAKLGGQLIVDAWQAELISPEGKHWDGYHYQIDYFDDGKQPTWDMFWYAIKNEEPCNCRVQDKGESKQ